MKCVAVHPLVYLKVAGTASAIPMNPGPTGESKTIPDEKMKKITALLLILILLVMVPAPAAAGDFPDQVSGDSGPGHICHLHRSCLLRYPRKHRRSRFL